MNNKYLAELVYGVTYEIEYTHGKFYIVVMEDDR